jgi:hypothetical protein
MADRFQLKKIPYGVYRSENRSASALGGPFIWFEAHMGLHASVRPHPCGVMSLRGGRFRENVHEARTREFCENFVENT